MGRRGKGDGAIYQRCEARYGCPPLVDGQRPDHTCQGRWYGVVDLSTPGGGRKRRTVSAKTRRELLPKLRRLQKRTEAGAVGDGSQTVAKWLTYWLDEVADLRPSTAKTYRGYINGWIVPEVGKVRLTNLSPEHVRGMLTKMERADRAPATRRQVLSILSKALEVAHREGKVDRNVCDTVARPSLAQQETHGVLTMEQLATLWPHLMAHPNRARWLAALVLGLRQGEALGLAWEDVHLDDPEPWLRVHQAQTKDRTLGPVKSKASDRTVPVIEPVHAALVDWRPRGDGGLVWGPRDTRADYSEWHALLRAAGLPTVPVHACRATAATVLDRMGATPRQVADILGQATVAVGQKHYVHSEQGDLRAVLTRAGASLTQE